MECLEVKRTLYFKAEGLNSRAQSGLSLNHIPVGDFYLRTS